MGEILRFRPKGEDEPLPGMELRDLVEGMSFLERIAYKRKMLQEMSDRETLVHLINDVNAAEGRTDE